MPVLPTHRLDEAEAVEPGHVDVGNDRVRLDPVEHFEPVDPVFGEIEFDACLAQSKFEHVANGTAVVDSKDFEGHADSPDCTSVKETPKTVNASSKESDRGEMIRSRPASPQLRAAETST